MQQVQLNVADEIKAAADALAVLAADIKDKKAIAAIVQDTLVPLVGALQGLSNFAADVKIADNQAYVVLALAKALEA